MATDVLIVLHEPDTTSGTTIEWCRTRGLRYKIVVPSRDGLEDVGDFARAIIFGGDVEAYDEEKHPWLAKEKAFIRRMLEIDKPLFGLCLGAQLIAGELGAEVKPMPGWEIGWRDVELLEGKRRLAPMHWHQSEFVLPDSVERIATNYVTSDQGFRRGSNVVGFQFHCEIDQQRLERLLKNHDSDKTGHVQPRDELIAQSELRMAELKDFYFQQLDLWASQTATN